MADPELKAQIAEAEKAVEIAKAEIEKAKAAGVDVTDLEKELADAEEALEKLKKAYA